MADHVAPQFEGILIGGQPPLDSNFEGSVALQKDTLTALGKASLERLLRAVKNCLWPGEAVTAAELDKFIDLVFEI